jgi:hypothetical protein
MALSHQLVTLSTSPTQLTLTTEEEIPYASEFSIVIQNTDLDIAVFLGASNVSSLSYGYKLLPGTNFAADLAPDDEIYAVAASGTPKVAIIKVQHNG